jgi:hypothetical protein
MSETTVQKYTEAPKKRGSAPISLADHGGKMYVVDGHHRIAAARRRGDTSIKVDIYGRHAGRNWIEDTVGNLESGR